MLSFTFLLPAASSPCLALLSALAWLKDDLRTRQVTYFERSTFMCKADVAPVCASPAFRPRDEARQTDRLSK